ncbi:hypothetical protein [Pseudodesulfovibrio sp. zrk46]|uniref:hypothetical protein n=1 Tax=Pseudodesulfovibrio sp. zrk46 TaxID=2725288 RepID=UPI00144907E8|nr:hypothetical protein [Pseudodesulfovibrio sp. zrk46]QJB56379.1 hypothetical protein HFN16_08100 [Pseudodesulfovibrio sp. zrk46]
MLVRIFPAFVLLFVLVATSPVANAQSDDTPDIAGEYLILGWDPGSDGSGPPDYQGKAVLRKWGDAWHYRGFMDDQTYAGAGLYDPKGSTLSLSFTNVSGVERGVTVLRLEADGKLSGRWVMDNRDKALIGLEVWTRKK